MKNMNRTELEIKLSPIINYLNWSNVSKSMGKTPQYMYQRIHGYTINNKQVELNDKARSQLRNELVNIAMKILKVTEDM